MKLMKEVYIVRNLFVPMLKENLNAENLNFSIHLLNYKLIGINFSDNPIDHESHEYEVIFLTYKR